MTRYFWMREDRTVAGKYGGVVDAWHKLSLPGVRCHMCGTTWSDVGYEYPSIDLSQLPERHEFVKARPEPFSEFARLRELVRPLAPPNAELPPGTGFGPLVGRATGDFGPIVWVGGEKLLLRRDVLERLQSEGVRGCSAVARSSGFARRTHRNCWNSRSSLAAGCARTASPRTCLHRARPVADMASASPTSPSWMRPPCPRTWTCSGWATSQG